MESASSVSSGKVVSGATCLLSMLPGLFIIFSCSKFRALQNILGNLKVSLKLSLKVYCYKMIFIHTPLPISPKFLREKRP